MATTFFKAIKRLPRTLKKRATKKMMTTLRSERAMEKIQRLCKAVGKLFAISPQQKRKTNICKNSLVQASWGFTQGLCKVQKSVSRQ